MKSILDSFLCQFWFGGCYCAMKAYRLKSLSTVVMLTSEPFAQFSFSCLAVNFGFAFDNQVPFKRVPKSVKTYSPLPQHSYSSPESHQFPSHWLVLLILFASILNDYTDFSTEFYPIRPKLAKITCAIWR